MTSNDCCVKSSGCLDVTVAEDNFINMEVVTPMDTTGDEETVNNDVTSSNAEACAAPPKVLPERRYSREVLISLMNHPLSRRRPTCLDSAALKNIVSTRGQNKNPWEQSGVERKRGDSNCEDDKGQGENSKRRVKQLGSLEPRERLRKEQDVVLSPQRRSFNSGCFVSLSTSQNRNFSSEHRGGRPESPAITKESRDVNHIGRDVGTRRIGSGRIMSRDPVWDYRDSDINQEHYRSRDERFDKRTFDRRNDHDKDKFQRDKVNNRYSGLGMDRRRTLTENKPEEEPEWFSGGPTSQHDTIELHGFEDLHDEKPMGNKKQNKKSNSRSNKKNLSESENKLEKSCTEIPIKKVNQKKNSTAQEAEIFIDKLVEKFSDVPIADGSNNQSDLNNILGSSSPCNDFNFDDFLKNSDRVVGLLSDRTEDEDHRGGSKFSRWFHQESAETPVQEQSVTHDSSIFSNILSDLTAPSEKKTDTDTYFAPISPAATSTKIKSQKTEINSVCHDKTSSMDQTSHKSSALLEILQGGARNQDRVLGTPSLQELEKTGKIHSVEELEAKLRRPNQEQNKEDGLAAFKKLFSLVSASKPRNSMADLSEKSTLQHMLNKANSGGQSTNLASDHKDQSGLLYSGNYQQQNFPLSSNIEHNLASQQMQIPQDLVMKLLHVQQQQAQQQQAQQQAQQQQPQQAQHLAKLLNNNVNSGTRLTPTIPQFNVPPPLSPLPPDIQQMISNAQPTNELLQRPEAQALIIGLKRGQISLYNLIEQLKKNSAIQPRHREVLACVIKMQQHQLQSGGVGPLAPPACDSSTTQPCGLTNSDQMLHQILLNQQQAQHQQQQLRIPSPHNSPYSQAPPLLSPNMAICQNNPNSFGIQHSVLQRVPSPRELVVHTQNIMQSALIKKKLEEQRENYRKRQELQRSHSPNIAASSGSTASSSVTTSTSPLAFTPTSVLRKMTAEKELTQTDSNSKSINADSQGNQAVGNRPVTIPTSQNQMRSNSWDILKPHKGRPIVKGSNSSFNYQPAGNTNIPTGIEFPHQFPNMTRNKMSASVQQNPALHYNSSLMVGVNQTSGNRARSIQQAHLAASLQAQQRNVNSSLQQILLNPNYGNNVRGNMKQDCRITQQPSVVRPGTVPGVGSYNQNPLMSGVGVRVEPSTSPVSNQLARWFSPELLAQARAGHLPDMSPTQNMLSVEELERLQQAVPN